MSGDGPVQEALDLAGEAVLEVVRPGPLATVQDLGRPGLAHLGVPGSGAADAPALRLANRLAGNPEDAAGLELTFGGAALRFRRAAWAAATGAPAPVSVDGRAAPFNAPFRVPAGGLVEVGAPARGVRTYVAVRGGLTPEPVLGSRSADLLSGLGPPPLAAGDAVPLGPVTGPGLALEPLRVDVAPVPEPPAEPRLRVLPGPRDDWFAAGALAALTSAVYTVADASNRVGVRFDGPPLDRVRDGELPSEGMVTGALQVPPDGRPILFLADHPTTGGYPVIAVVTTADIPVAAQLRPGTKVRFTTHPR
ncbi:biotin-dependent carboxyltransferase family protein [Actinomadura atramentaria]|uniref:5-oxoprolinase subunit C family protein n=1 Tax=Actinomadura atramentaria TaxID=1990 RepID=UPI000382062D|nr:biotin-dependent carboxyltransferase family protein [Actinomadura atramentaria]